MNINSFLIDMEHQVKESPNYTSDRFFIKQNKNFQTILMCKKAIIRIRQMKLFVRIEIKSTYLCDFGLKDYFIDAEKDWIIIDKAQDTVFPNLIVNAEKVFNLCYQDEAVESFGCCNRFIECSDAKVCIHPDQLFAKGCLYKDNLENGLIFYGQNRNV